MRFAVIDLQGRTVTTVPTMEKAFDFISSNKGSAYSIQRIG